MSQDEARPYSFTLDPFPQQAPEWNRASAFYDHLREGRLTTTRCRTCDLVSWPPRSVCPECHGDDLEWIDLPTEGRILAATVQVAGTPPGFPAALVFALLEFTPDVRFIGRILTEDLEAAVADRMASLVVQEVSRDRVVPAFRLV